MLGGSGPTESATKAYLRTSNAMAKAKRLWEMRIRISSKREFGKTTRWFMESVKFKQRLIRKLREV